MQDNRLQKYMNIQKGNTFAVCNYATQLVPTSTRVSLTEEESKLELSKMLDEETLFRFAYVPFVIAELCWDYADTVIDMAILCRKTQTKKLSRKIRELRKEYDAYHDTYIDRQHKDGEIDNMLVYEEGVKEITQLFLINLNCELLSIYPELERNEKDLVVSAYECLIVLKSLFLYAEKQTRKIEKIVGHRIGQIIPKELRALVPLLEAFIGDKPVREQFNRTMQEYAKTFSTQMALIELSSVK